LVKQKNRPHYAGVEQVIRITQTLVQFTLYHSVACLITSIGREESTELYLRMGILLLPLFLYSFTRAYVGNLLLFFLIHLGSAFLLVWSFPQTVGEAAALFLCLIVMLVNSFRFRITESYHYKECPNLLMLLFIFLVYGTAAYIHHTLLMQICFYELIIFILFYMIGINLENTEQFIKINQDTANFPVRQIKGVNRTLLSFFTLLMFMVMVLAPRLHPELLTEKAGNLLLLFLRWFFSLFSFHETVEESVALDLGRNATNQWMELEEAEPSWIALFLQELLLFLTKVFLIFGILVGIGFGLYQFYKRFYAIPKKGESELEGKDVVTIVERVPIFQRKKTKEEEIGGNSKKIRHQYKKSVKRRKGKQQVLAEALTPSEIEATIEHKIEEEQRKKVIALYEKARYGKIECTKEELEEFKKIM